ncbi:hypothetical protein ACSBR1_015703 [Camellia fascicularis]
MQSHYEEFATIDSDERRRLLVQPTTTPVTPVLSDQMAVATNSSSRGSIGSVTCHHCGASVQFKTRCFKLHPELRQRSSRPHV